VLTGVCSITDDEPEREALEAGSEHVVLSDSPDAGSLLWHNCAFWRFQTSASAARAIGGTGACLATVY